MRYRNYYFWCVILLLLVIAQNFAQVNTEKLRNNEADKGFQNTIGFGFGLLSGNSEQYRILGNYRLDWLSTNYYSFAVLNYERGKSGGKVFTDKGFIHARVTRDLTDRWIAEVFGQKEFNKMISLKDRQLAGGGLRFEIRKLGKESTEQKLVVGLGSGFMYEIETTTAPKDIHSIMRSTNYTSINWQMIDRLTLTSTTYFQISVKRRTDYRILDESALSFNINKTLSFNTSFIYRYDHEPPPDVKKYDMTVNNGVSVRF
jgi:putative salt-induced outer membrane protein YdiY